MVDIEFDFNQRITVIQAKLDDTFQDVINKYLDKNFLAPDSVYFLTNGKQINPTQSVESHMNDLNKINKNMKVLVYKFENGDENNEQVIVKSEDIICPKCKEPCLIGLDNYRIKLYDCINGHITKDIKITEFDNTQKVNLSQIVCDKCKIKNKGNCPKDDFYKCVTCKQNLCLLCKPNHNSKHNVIRYDQKNYICLKHNDSLINYCQQCKKNICFACEEHKDHKTIFLGDLKPDIEAKKGILEEFKSMKESINLKVQEIIKQLNHFVEIINIYYNINNAILNNFNVQNRNYQNLENINNIDSNNIIFLQLKKIIETNPF